MPSPGGLASDSKTAIALITAYEADHTNELWDVVYKGIEPGSLQYVMFAMAALATAAIGSYSRALGLSFEDLIAKIGMVIEERDSRPPEVL